MCPLFSSYHDLGDSENNNYLLLVFCAKSKESAYLSIIIKKTTAAVLEKKKEVVKQQRMKHKYFRSIPGRNEAAALNTRVCFPHHAAWGVIL